MNLLINTISIQNYLFNYYCTNLTQIEQNNFLGNYFGREKELDLITEILLQSTKIYPLLIGPKGIGKKSLIKLLVKHIQTKNVPFILHKKQIISLNLKKLLAPKPTDLSLALKLKILLDIFNKNSNLILVINNFHDLFKQKNKEIDFNIINFFQEFLIKINSKIIAITNDKGFEEISKIDKLNSFFKPFFLKELSKNDSLNILYNIRPNLEKYYNVSISNLFLLKALDFSIKHISNEVLPIKAITLIEIALSKYILNEFKKKEFSYFLPIVYDFIAKLNKLEIESFRLNNIKFQILLNYIRQFYLNIIIPALKGNLDNQLKNKIFKLQNNFTLKNLFEFNFLSKFYFLNFLEINNYKIYKIEKNNLINKINKITSYRLSTLLFYLTNFILKYKKIYNFKKIKNNVYYILKNIKIKNIIINFIKNKKFKFYISDIYFIKNNNYLLNLKFEYNFFISFLTNLKPLINKKNLDLLILKSNIQFQTKNSEFLFYSLFGYYNTNFKFIYKNLIKLYTYSNKLSESYLLDAISFKLNSKVTNSSNLNTEDILKLDQKISKQIIGQEEAIFAITKAVQRSKLGIRDPKKPVASFLFCGPTGVGKTEITKVLCKLLYGSENALIRFDMSEFMDKNSTTRLIGAPAGYIGYENGGQLTDLVAKKPYSVLLFDEIEKAHPDVCNLLLQVLDEGHLTDNQKNIVFFNNTIIILTSNLGSKEILNLTEKQNLYLNSLTNTSENLISEKKNNLLIPTNNLIIGSNSFLNFIKIKFNNQINLNFSKNLFSKQDTLKNLNLKFNKKLKKNVLEKLEKSFSPEFLNRLDDIILFKPLTRIQVLEVTKLLINNLKIRLNNSQIYINIDNSVLLFLATKGYNPTYGIRPLKRLILKNIENNITEFIIKNSFSFKNKILNISLDKKNNILINYKE